MKMTNFFKMALMGIFAAGVFTACGGDDDNPNPNPNPGGGDDPKTAPTITLTGAQTSGSESSSLTFKLTLKNAESAKYLTVLTSELNNALNSATLEELVQSEGDALTSSQLQNALGQGLDLVFTQLEPNTEYTCAVYAVNGTESAVKSAAATTANGGGGGVTPGTGSDAYNAWIGTWNVTSTSSLIGSDPMSFTVSIAELNADQTYAVTGWGISMLAAQQPVGAIFNAEDGGLYFVNGQELGEVSGPQGESLMVTYLGVCGYNNSWTVVSGDYYGLIGAMGADGNSATVTGEQLEISTGDVIPVYTFDFFGMIQGENSFYTLRPADGFTADDYPIGPYTLTKSGSAASSKGLHTYFAAPQAKKAGYPVRLLSEEVRTAIVAK